MDLKFTDLKTEYLKLENSIIRLIPDSYRNEILYYCVAAAVTIWGSNELYSPDYATLLAVLTDENYTTEQTLTAMGCCGDTERKLNVPDFFKACVDYDKENRCKETERIIGLMNDFLVAAAMINGDFTLGEANCLSFIISGLIEYAESNYLIVEKHPDNSSMVTGKKLETYLQNDFLAAADDKKQNAVPTETVSENPAPINITLNTINLTTQNETAETNENLVSNEEDNTAVTNPQESDEDTFESLLAELDGLVGLENVKRDVHSLMNFIKVTKIREKRGMKVPTISYHLVFTGNPGTGKTTVARLVAKLYYHMGILPQGQLVETDRSALVAGYLGQTAIKTQKVIQQAMGGVLFIDEAYSLAGDEQDSYGKEAIETILKSMEDHRDELVVIVAGYTDLMHRFIESNPGLSSRFSKYFEFPDYTGDELIAIFRRFCTKNGYSLDDSASVMLKNRFDELYEKRDKHFGNARTARNIFEKAINAQADRIASQISLSDSDLEIITADDIAAVIGGAN